jgi:SAM-dependent MidA family methyltransferase
MSKPPLGLTAVPRIISGLPEPDEDARRHGERVVAQIRVEIERQGGSIPFSRYMDLALHAPALGYYSAGSAKFGAGGDFVTAPEISTLFGRCLARQAIEIFDVLGEGEIFEFGAGSGAMAVQILAELDRLRAPSGRYLILESSADLREQQRATIQRRIPHLSSRIEWLDRLPERFSGVVVANEVLDAMPVHRVVFDRGTLREQCVCWHHGGFAWTTGPLSDARLQPRIERLVSELGAESFSRGYIFEINLAAEDWIAATAGVLARGALLIIDYGFPRREFYHPQRGGGTLMCHYRHRAHGDPLILTGLQDITAHLDFSALAETAASNGLEVAGYATQANFLLANGLAEMAEGEMARGSDVERARLSHEIQRLTFPGEMGEQFKVMALTRGIDAPLSGFALRDQRGGL